MKNRIGYLDLSMSQKTLQVIFGLGMMGLTTNKSPYPTDVPYKQLKGYRELESVILINGNGNKKERNLDDDVR